MGAGAVTLGTKACLSDADDHKWPTTLPTKATTLLPTRPGMQPVSDRNEFCVFYFYRKRVTVSLSEEISPASTF